MTGAAAMRNGSIEADGSTLHFLVEGSGIPVLVLGSVAYYRRTFAPRLRQSVRMAYADMRHFARRHSGASARGITLHDYLDDIERLRDAIGFQRFVLVGHSHHGNLALEYARQHPARVSHLALIATPPSNVAGTLTAAARFWDEQASAARKAALLRRALGANVLAAMPPDAAFVAQYVAEAPKYWYDVDYDASPLWRAVPVNMQAMAAFRSFFTDYRFGWDAEQMQAPVLSVAGTHDFAVPHILWEAALPGLRNVTYRLLEACGHTPQLEAADAFDQAFLEWLLPDGGVS